MLERRLNLNSTLTLVLTISGLWSLKCSRVAAMSISLVPTFEKKTQKKILQLNNESPASDFERFSIRFISPLVLLSALPYLEIKNALIENKENSSDCKIHF